MSSWQEERRQDRRLEAELRQQRDQATAERRRQDRIDEAEQTRKDKLADQARLKKEQAERRQRRVERTAAARAWVSSETVTVFLLAFVAVAVVSAFHGQYRSLRYMGIGPVWAALIGAAIEAATWVTTLLGDEDAKKGRPAGPMRTAMWTFAAIAASFNLYDGLTSPHPQQGFALAFLTPAAVFMWDARQKRRHGVKMRTRAERAAEKARKAHTAKRAADHQDVQRTAERIVSAGPFEAVAFEEAFASAWEVHHGTREVGLTPAMVALRAQSKRRMVEAVGTEADDAPLFPDTVPADWAEAFGGTVGTVYRSPIGGPDGDDDEGGEGVPRTAPRKPSSGPSEAAGALGGKGKRRIGGGRRERVQRPLDPADVEKVRAYADLIAESNQRISVRTVNGVIGGREKEYVSRLTRHVKELRGEA